MAAPLNLEEGQSSTRPPCFNGHFYSWWKVRIHDYLMAEDSELWDIVLDGPFIPMMEEKDGEKTNLVPKPRQKYDEACESVKEIWDCLKTAHEGTEQVKESKIDMLTSWYENFKMKEGETIHDMFTKLSSIKNELRSLGETISMTKQVRKVLRILPKSWESKVDAITEAKDLKVLTMDALIGNLKIHEMNRNYDLSKKEAKKDKSLMLKYKSDEDSSDDDMTYLISRFQKIEHQKSRSDKENLRDLVLGKRDRRAAADLVVKKALAAWGDSSSDSKDPDEPNDVSMVVLHEEETVFKEMFALMAHTENEEEDNQITEEAEKLNGMSNGLQDEIQEKLKNSEKNLGLSLEMSNKLEKDIDKLKEELENSLKWTKSSKLLTNATNQSNFNKKGLGSLNITPPYNPHSKYVFVSDNLLCLIVVSERSSSQCWLKYTLLSVSQICDKGNEVKFTSEKCTVVSLTTKKVILTVQRSKNMYVANLETSHGDDLTCLSAQNENANLWHRRLGHVSSSLLNKLISKDLVRGLPKLKFAENKICEACVKGKQIRSSFKPKKQVTSSRTLELLHMDLCGPLKVQSRNGKKHILVIIDDYSRYTWTRFLKSKADTAEELVVFFKMIPTKLNQVICSIRSYHGTEFEN
ncbi:uncharacterized protein [Solanum lycopersicum]|uniref:uncharacterized protein n=1 Tax=Solanum lycopersicum TaxID=4081 RepID=UPI0037493BB2